MESVITEIIIVLLLILLSGFLAAAEIAIATFGPNKIDELKERKDKSAFAFSRIQKDTNSFFGTIQLTTQITLLAAAMLGFHLCYFWLSTFFEKHTTFDNNYVIVLSVIIALIIISFLTMVFGTLIPKALGFKYADRIARLSVHTILAATYLFSILIRFATYMGNLLLKPFNEKTNFSQTRFSEDEIRIIISEGVKTGAIDKSEQEIIENIFEFNDVRARDVMIPRTELVALDLTDNKEEMNTEIMKSNHSIIPVYQDNLDNVVGIIHTKDIMKTLIRTKDLEVKSIMRPAYFIPESKLISEVLREMQKRGERLAVVMDEYGGTEGVITMEDILEEIVGDLHNNNIKEEKLYYRLPDGSYYVNGSMYIEDFNETFNIDIPLSDEYNTVAGFIADKTGKILNAGEQIQHETLIFELIKKIRQKMVQFKVHSTGNDFGESVKEENIS
jgi:putative hemolysin